jgi:ATP-binding cassette subfamily C protein
MPIESKRSATLSSFVREAISALPKRERRLLVALAVARTSISAIDLLAILVLGAGVERLSVEGGSSAAPLLIGAGIAMLIRSAGTLAIARVTFRFLARIEIAIGQQFTESVFSAPQEVLDGVRTQELAFALSQGTNSLTTRALGFSMIVAADGLAAVGIVIAFTVVYPLEGMLMVLSVVALMWPVQRYVNRRIHRASSRWSAATISVLNEVNEFQSSRREIFLNSASKRAAERLGVGREESARQASEFNFMLTVPRIVIEIATLAIAAVLLLVAYQARSNEEFIVFAATLIAVTFRLAPLAMGVVGSLGVITQSQGETVVNRRIREAISSVSEPQPARASGSRVASRVPHAIHLRDVAYRFPGTQHDTLTSVSLEIGVNEFCAIVGSSGAGKTTLLECMIGLRSVQTGDVTILGESPATIRREAPGSIGLVPQAPSVRTTSIAENISFLSPHERDHQLVERLIERVGLGQLVRRCPDGIDTIIGEGHLQLSGGEKQRLGLARALYSNPMVLVLDEPTSALDGLSEEHVFALLEAERSRRTIVVVTHRRPQYFTFDQTFVVEGGRVRSA